MRQRERTKEMGEERKTMEKTWVRNRGEVEQGAREKQRLCERGIQRDGDVGRDRNYGMC